VSAASGGGRIGGAIADLPRSPDRVAKENVMSNEQERYRTSEYFKKRRKLTGLLFEIALPNEYLVRMGQKKVRPVLGGKGSRLFRKYLRVPASVQTLYFKTDNANMDYQGIGVEGYASWRIDPSRPEVALTTLDFFDENDPMARTNSELRTICVEAVRHVLANMSIDDSLKKKDDIAESLLAQLKAIESKWGILFDQVGIESVRIMSDALFQNLQAEFRDTLRLDVEKKRILTDSSIATEENANRERTELGKLETDKQIQLMEVERKTQVRDRELTEQDRLEQKERDFREQAYRKSMVFEAEKAKSDNDQASLVRGLELSLADLEKRLLNAKLEAETLKVAILAKSLESEARKREIEQSWTPEALTSLLVEKLPEIFGSVKIDSWSVLDAGGGEGVSPLARLLGEIILVLKSSKVQDLFTREPPAEK
jgi:hypothetical protein